MAAETIAITIDGASFETPAGGSVLDAVLGAGVDLPHLCKDLRRAGAGGLPDVPG